MLTVLTTHPIQYQVPLWQALAKDGRIPFEVWYLTSHAVKVSRDREFQQDFAWDLDTLEGYPHRFVKTPPAATPNTFWRCRIAESLPELFKKTNTKAIWIQGWQVAAYWQAAWAAEKAGVEVWLRGESNALRWQPAAARQQDDKTTGRQDQSPVVSSQWFSTQGSKLEAPTSDRSLSAAAGLLTSGSLRLGLKRLLLGQLFRRVDHFLCIGTANRELYRSYGVPESKLHMAPYAVDNERFASQARELEDRRWEIRKQWSIPQESFCVLFCGKFIPKKRPIDLIKAAQLLLRSHPELKTHLLFAGSGELGGVLRAECDVVFDADAPQRTEDGGQKAAQNPDNGEQITDNAKPRASFAGFLNQTEVSAAYVAADVLVLPSDYDETWGLVVNEAMASGLPSIVSDQCGCAEDLGAIAPNTTYQCGDTRELADRLAGLRRDYPQISFAGPLSRYSFSETLGTIMRICQ